MRLATCLAAALLLGACTTSPMKSAATPLEFVVVRHAEKAAAGGDDPPLVEAGRARADVLAARLADAPVVAVYSTGYARTRQTAAPMAVAHGLQVTPYDARESAAAFATRLRAVHPAGTVVIVGHSNTVPAIAAALCGCEVAPMEETEYDRLLVVTVSAGGDAALVVDRQPAATAR